MRPAALVRTAAQRFTGGDDPSFIACFHENVEFYWEPAVAERPIVSSRAALEAWLGRLREQHADLDVTITDPTEHGNGAVCEVIVTPGTAPSEVWRAALACCVRDDLICEVRAFWARDAAVEWVASFR